MAISNIIPIPIVQSGTGLVDFKVFNAGTGSFTDVRVNASGYLVNNGTVSPTGNIRVGTMPSNSFAGVEISVTPNVQGIIKTNQALVTYNPGAGDVTATMPNHYIIAPSASPKVWWGAFQKRGSASVQIDWAVTSGAGFTIFSGDFATTTTVGSGFILFPGVGVVAGFSLGNAMHPSDLPIKLSLAENVMPGGMQLNTFTDLAIPNISFPGAAWKYYHSGQTTVQQVILISGVFADAYNDTYVFPTWDSIDNNTTSINTANINALRSWISGGGRIMLLDDAVNWLAWGSLFSGTSVPTNIPFNLGSLIPANAGSGTKTGTTIIINTNNTTAISMQSANQNIVARSGDTLTSQLFKPYSIDNSEVVTAIQGSTFGSMYITSGIIGTGNFKFGIQESLSGYVLAGYSPAIQDGAGNVLSGHMFWVGAQGGSLVTTWALNALFMAGKKWTSDTISGGYAA